MAEEKKSKAAKELGGEHKEKPKHKHKVKEMHVRKADSGGYISRHEMEKPMSPEEGGPGGPTPPEETHVLPDMKALQDHMAQHLPEQEPEGQSQQSQEPQPAQA